MSGIDFQNGFACGMATKGLVRSGELYKPIIWNDSGEYGYFYIDFRRDMQSFSTGMFQESIIVHDSEQIPVTDVVYVSPGIYKVTCNIADKMNGITVINKKTTLLSFSNGGTLPVFSTLFYVAGITPTVRLHYCFDSLSFSKHGTDEVETINFTPLIFTYFAPPNESCNFHRGGSSVIETPTLILI